jgi:hypothetical protein
MRYLMKSAAVTAMLLGLATAPASAVIVLDFEGLDDLEAVVNFYNGGLGGGGSGPGPNYGIVFSSNALAAIDSDAGGSGSFGGEPSPSTAMFFSTGTAIIMDVAAGFDTGFSLFYSAPDRPGSINVYDGLGGTGILLATLTLPLTPLSGAPDPTGAYSPFVPLGVAFSGIAMSVDFGGSAGEIGFDDVTFGSVTPGNVDNVPEPMALSLLCAGLLSIGAVRRRKA